MFNEIHCEKHMEYCEINLVERNCVKCNLPYVLNAKDECPNCDPEKASKRILVQQTKVKNYLDQNNFVYNSTDIMLDKGMCGKERPDFVFEKDTCCIILEVDEHQHSNIAYKCEQERMFNIAQSCKGSQTLFIRYNPDNYTVNKTKMNTTDTLRLKELGEFLKHY